MNQLARFSLFFKVGLATAALFKGMLIGTCLAQTPLSTPASPSIATETAAAQPANTLQTVQKIRTEDAGSRIDELRVGGETQSITVQPKTGTSVPSYEVKPSDTNKGDAPSPSSGDTAGARVWNVLKF